MPKAKTAKQRRPSAAPDPAAGVSFGVVVLNWNNVHDTILCLDSLFSATPRPDHVVVVDNGSTDRSVSRIEQWAAQRNLQRAGADGEPWLKIIEAGVNRGFAGGNNLGIKYIERRTEVTHVMLFNNDATVDGRFFAEMGAAIRSAPDAGLLSGTIYEDPDRRRVWYAGGIEFPLRALVQHTYSVPQSATPLVTEFVSGCAMVISRELIEEIGPLAECYYPLYWEDGEYSFRARAAGFPVLYVPRAVAYHKVGATVGPAHRETKVAHSQNRLRVFYVRRNYRGWLKGAALTYLAVTKPARAVIEAVKGRPAIGWAILSGTVSGFVSSEARR